MQSRTAIVDSTVNNCHLSVDESCIAHTKNRDGGEDEIKCERWLFDLIVVPLHTHFTHLDESKLYSWECATRLITRGASDIYERNLGT